MNMDLQAIKQLAEEKIRQYNPKGVVPFPFQALASAVGNLDIFYSNTMPENISGATLLNQSRFSILINSNKAAVRQYFTTAHELGHYFIHRQLLQDNTVPGFVDYSNSLDVPGMLLRSDNPQDMSKEREANNFAAELIMPEDKVREAWKLTQDIGTCAKIFQVSQTAMAIRLERLGLAQ
jgi:Zn-dependent peptidase ImmA (M78 family)